MSNPTGDTREAVATWRAPAWARRTIAENEVIYHERPAERHVVNEYGTDATPVLRTGDLLEIEAGAVRVTRSEPAIVVPVEGGELSFSAEQARALAAAFTELADLAEQPAAELASVMAFRGGA